MEYMNLQIAAHNVSGEVYMERVAPGAGVSSLTNFISGESSAGVYPSSAVSCIGHGRIVIRSLFASGCPGVSILPLGYDANNKLIGPLTVSPDETEIIVTASQAETEGKYVGPVVSVSNEDVGASSFKVQILSASGEVYMDYALL